jgi:hypothetical protein
MALEQPNYDNLIANVYFTFFGLLPPTMLEMVHFPSIVVNLLGIQYQRGDSDISESLRVGMNPAHFLI